MVLPLQAGLFSQFVLPDQHALPKRPQAISQLNETKTNGFVSDRLLTGYLLLCSIINYIDRIVSRLPGWLPRLTSAQTLPYPHVATHCRFKTLKKGSKDQYYKDPLKTAKVNGKPVSDFICFTQ